MSQLQLRTDTEFQKWIDEAGPNAKPNRETIAKLRKAELEQITEELAAYLLEQDPTNLHEDYGKPPEDLIWEDVVGEDRDDFLYEARLTLGITEIKND